MSVVTTAAATVDLDDLRVLEQKAARLEAALERGGTSFATLIGDARNLIYAARAITYEHLPAAEPAKEPV